MTAVRARHAVLRGSVEAAALLVDPAITGEAAARARVLSLWTPDASVLSIDGAYLLRLAVPQRVDAQFARGLPFVRRAGVLVSVDVDEEELRALGGFAAGTVVMMRAGVVVARAAGSADVVDPALWLDLGEFMAVATESLAAPPAPPTRAIDPVPHDVREILPVAPMESPEKASAMLAALARARSRTSSAPGAAGHRATSDGPKPSELLTRLLFWLILLAAFQSAVAVAAVILVLIALAAIVGGAILVKVARKFRRSSSVDDALQRLARASGGGRASRPRRGTAAAGERESRWRRFFERVFATLQLSRLIGRAHAKYLADLLQKFDDGDLDAALRLALPLGGGEGGESLSFRAFHGRDSLAITSGRGGATQHVPVDAALMQHLRTLYRDAFERLDRAGRVDDAAFVLAELLNSSDEAVSYLERKGRLVTAAQVAEARELPADLVVRQWILAGDRKRAVAIARSRHAFASAVARLEHSHPETAALLRGLWGEWLASSGRYAAAVDAVSPVASLRHVANEWLERGIAQGGTQSARLLARRLEWRDDRDALEPVLEQLDAADEELRDVRAAIAESLLALPKTPVVAIAARAAVRSVLRDGIDLPQKKIRKLAELSGDAALQADLPSRAMRAAWRDRNGLLHIGIDVTDTGTQPVYDVAALNDGRIAVALGENGVEMLDKRGRRIARFDEPAHRLVISDERDRAIAISGRGAVVRLSRIDFGTRRAAYWCDARMSGAAQSYDGGIWFVFAGTELLAIDATGSRFESLWHYPDFPSPIRTIARDERQLTIAGSGRESVHMWRYELPSLTLRERSVIAPAMLDPAGPYVAAPDGALLATETPRTASWTASVLGNNPGFMNLESSGQICIPQALSTSWLIASDSTTVFIADRRPAKLRARITLNGASAFTTRVQGDTLSVADDRGRVIVLDTTQAAHRGVPGSVGR